MSDSIKNKLYNFEEMPPVSAWRKVALSLDEKILQKTTVTQLYNQEECPPEGIWDKITATLDTGIQEAKFRNEILEDEVAPPPFTWNKIAQQLDAVPQENLSKKILAFEVAPPVGAWDKIATSLDADKEDAPVIPIRKSYTKIFRIAAAAAIIGIIVWVGFGLLQNGKISNENSLADNGTINTPTTAPVVVTTPPVDEINNTTPTEKDNTVTKQKTTIQKPGNMDENTLVDPAGTDNHATAEDFAVTDNKNLHKKHKSGIPTGDNTTDNPTTARYLIYLNEQGKMVNLSKKLADLQCIYNSDGGVSQESLAKLDATECNEQLKYWQDKMANSPLQSSSNPLELIEVLR